MSISKSAFIHNSQRGFEIRMYLNFAFAVNREKAFSGCHVAVVGCILVDVK